MKKKIVIKKKFITFLLIYLILFTSYFSVITLSKYVGTTRGAGTTAIAKWEVSVDTSDNDSNTLNLVSGNTTQNYILKLTSTSETVATYSIILSNVPSELEVKLDDGSYMMPVDNTITYEDVGYINANASNRTVTHTLTFNAPIDSNILSTNQINIDVKFVQKRAENTEPAFTGTIYRNNGNMLINGVTMNGDVTVYYPSDEYESAIEAFDDMWIYMSEEACLEENENCASGTVIMSAGEYTTEASELNTNIYLKHDIEDNIVVASYSCFVTDTEHCIKGGINEQALNQEDRQVYNANKLILQGQLTWFQNNSGDCDFDDEYSFCQQNNRDGLYFGAGIDGSLSVRREGIIGCDIDHMSFSYCWNNNG